VILPLATFCVYVSFLRSIILYSAADRACLLLRFLASKLWKRFEINTHNYYADTQYRLLHRKRGSNSKQAMQLAMQDAT
jgi:hypothetical protein